MADNWDAIIVNNYEAVFPMPFRKKWGIKYVYHPAFIQQLGLCTTTANIKVSDILPILMQHFKYADLFLNYTNCFLNNLTEKTNFVLYLNKNYAHYRLKYKYHLKRKLNINNTKFLNYRKNYNTKEAIYTYKNLYADKHKSINDKDYSNFLKLCEKLALQKKVFTRSVYDEKEQLLSIALFLFENDRIYNIINCTTQIGRNTISSHYLIDRLIEEFSETNNILDFEGSDLKGVKRFYENFSPKKEPYFYYKINNLHPLLKLFKK